MKKGAPIRRGTGAFLLKRVDQIELIPVQVRLNLTRCGDNFLYDRRIAVQSSPVPPIEARDRIAANLPQRINMVLEDIGGSSLFTFGEGGQNSVLLLTPKAISDLDIILVLREPNADVTQIPLPLLTQAGDRFALAIEGVIGGIQVVLEFQDDVDWPALQAGLQFIA
jgi:hypothetical protein